VIVLDASVVIALLDKSDLHHDRSLQLFDENAPEGFFMHSLTMAEVLVVAARNGSANARFAQLSTAGISVAPQLDDEPVALAELRASTGLRLPDCCVLVAALHSGSAVATFDERLAREAARVGVLVVSR